MGIRNSSNPDASGNARVRSLPLMGIRNAARRAEDGRHDAGLTTPHGDQELEGNLRVPNPFLHLTTPHGDQEPARTSGPAAIATAHYPSWGSGTRTKCSSGIVRHDLTTPHGDQELPSVFVATAPTVISLPLMGIRNEALDVGPVASMSSAPPTL